MARRGRLGGVLAAASAGWWFGFGYFLAGLYWLGHAFLVDAKTFGWLLPFAVTALPAAMAIYTALGLALARAIWTRGATRVLALAVALTLAEWLRGHLFSGFPWNTYGYALISPLWLAQGAALIGIWGLTFLAVAIYASPAVLADARTDTKRPWLAPALSVAVIAALAIYGAVRLAGTSTSYVDGVHLRIMQPNLQQDDKFNYARKQQVMSRYLALSDRAHGTQSTGLQRCHASDLAGIRVPVLPHARTRRARTNRRASQGRDGADHGRDPRARYDAPGRSREPRLQFDLRDRARWLDPVGLRQGSSRPVRGILAVSGPARAARPEQLTKVRGGFIPGDRRHDQSTYRARRIFCRWSATRSFFQAMRCPTANGPAGSIGHIGRYFDWPFVAGSGERPGWLLNLTNDGWFGASAGPYQHFQQARVRAIEEGLPLVRAANTGISAVVDPFGRVIASLPLGVEGVLDAPLPQPIAPTPYARLGDVPAGIMVVRRACMGDPGAPPARGG